MKLIFNSIKKEDIFEPEFENLQNGTLCFCEGNSRKIDVIYASNGTGKSSFAKVLRSTETKPDIGFSAQLVQDGVSEQVRNITPEDNFFHVIPEHINRNVIRGDETDYLVGTNIRTEHKLQSELKEKLEQIVDFRKTLTNDYKIQLVGHPLLKTIESECRKREMLPVYAIIRCLVNRNDRGQKLTIDDVFKPFCGATVVKPQALTSVKRDFLIDVLSGSSGTTIPQLLKLARGKKARHTSSLVYKLEQDSDALSLLQKYPDSKICIVCGNKDYNQHHLVEEKESEIQSIYEPLDETSKDILRSIVEKSAAYTRADDPYNIKDILLAYIAGTDSENFVEMCADIREDMTLLASEILYKFLTSIPDREKVKSIYGEYCNIRKSKYGLESDDEEYIKRIISDHLEKDITLERRGSDYKLTLSGQRILNVDREELKLSTGEQNFISLAFELLLAKNSDKEFIVLDDPISSFDSIFKNKICYCIYKLLENKKVIVLTHTTDVIRLLHYQKNNGFNLYILSNTSGGNNGFIPVNDVERDILIDLNQLLHFFHNDPRKCKDGNTVKLDDLIIDRRLFLMSMIPFLRGYGRISIDFQNLDSDGEKSENIFSELSEIMHGFKTGKVDVAEVYKKILGYEVSTEPVEISVDDVLALDCRNIEILDASSMPLLAETLRQMLIYYHLRMKVERVLFTKFNLQEKFKKEIKKNKSILLTQIILKAFEEDKYKEYRIFFTSRKTLLNDFNHYDGNLNIFQPAIDISAKSLDIEVSDIEKVLDELQHR